MKFGTPLPFVQQMPGSAEWTTGDDIDALRRVAATADELGFDWLPCSDHVVIPERAVPTMGATWYEPATTLAFVAGFTKRIRLLSHVLILPNHSPFDVAKQYATLDRLSGGRVILGAGVGHLRAEFRALRANYEERGAVTDEHLRIIKTLWTDESASYSGRYHEFWNVYLAPRPVQQPHPPVWIGGNSRRAARRAVELGDGWVPFAVALDELVDRITYLRSLPAFHDRRTPFDIIAPAATVVITDHAVDGERPPFTGSAEQIIEDLRAYADVGVTGITIGFPSRSLAEHLEHMQRFAEDVMPAFPKST
jgi:probable F420-dependent oxidoreductase